MAKKRSTSKKAARTRVQLIESDSQTPTIQVQPGVRIEMVAITTGDGKASRIAARLCGYGSGSCLALVEIE